MGNTRPTIPKEIKRAIFIEAGHRCAIPTCKAPSPLEIAHIESWSESKNHNFDNLICLCANCHSRFDKGQDGFDKQTMRVYKQNLSKVRNQYSDFENILFEQMIIEKKDSVILHDLYEPFLFYSIKDGLLIRKQSVSGNIINGISQGPFIYQLTKKGKDFLTAMELGKKFNPTE